MRADRAGRAVRGALAGTVTTLLALAFHVFGGGTAPGGIAVVGSLLAAVWVCTMLAGRRLRPWLLVVAVTIAQLVLHTVFSMATATVSSVPAAPMVGGHQHGDAIIGSMVHGGHAMWVAHLAAGVVTVLGILCGDRVLAGLGELGTRVVARLRPLVPAPLPVGAIRIPVPAAPVFRTLADRAASVVARRGPPAVVAV